MILSYGTHDFDDNEIQFAWNNKLVLGKAGRASHYVSQCKVLGVKLAVDAAALTTALTTLETKMAIHNVDLTFKDNTPANTVHVVTSTATLNGVRAIGGVTYPIGLPGVWGSQTEYANKRTFQVVFQWETSAAESNLQFYEESIRLIGGGGPKFVIQEALTGVPLFQQVTQFSKQVAIQSGTAVGFTSYPSFPSYAYSIGLLKQEKSFTEEVTPRDFHINTNANYMIRWSYHFEAPSGISLITPALPTF
jgi:hypothetical protein